MSRTILSSLAVAAMLSVAASGAASGKGSPQITFPDDPRPAGRIGPSALAHEPDVANRSFKTAFTLLELLNHGPSGNKSGNLTAKQGRSQHRPKATQTVRTSPALRATARVRPR
jgi:hypothetical protein